MKRKLSLLFVLLLLAAVLSMGWYLQQPVSALPPAVRTVNGITLEAPHAPQYQAIVFGDQQRPVVGYLLRLPAGARRIGGSDARRLLQREIETRMTNLARLSGEYALFAGEAVEQQRLIPIHPDEFAHLFDFSNGVPGGKAPYDALAEIWTSQVAPHRETSRPVDAAAK